MVGLGAGRVSGEPAAGVTTARAGGSVGSVVPASCAAGSIAAGAHAVGIKSANSNDKRNRVRAGPWLIVMAHLASGNTVGLTTNIIA